MRSRIVAACLGALVLFSAVMVSVLPPATAAAESTGVRTVGCSWLIESNPSVANVAYPDTNAYYWLDAFVPLPGDRLVVTGQYPAARYMSFHVYDATLVAMDSLYDVQINPDPGSSNPFRGTTSAKSGDSYRVVVEFAPRPAHPMPNTLYVEDIPQGVNSPTAFLIYRVYVPTNPSSQTGGVPLPTITLETSSGTPVTTGSNCSTPVPEGDSDLNTVIANSSFPVDESDPVATDTPSWSRAYSSNLYGLFGNDQNAYITASISRQYGDLVVVHGRAPTFPNTRAGQPVSGRYDMRYWSMCQNSDTTRVLMCAADYQTTVKDGYYTYVISDPDIRPANATTANGVTWLAWGGAYYTGVLIMRNMLPLSTFHNAVQDVAKGQSVQRVMGAYYPQVFYCAPATFAAGGWKACASAKS